MSFTEESPEPVAVTGQLTVVDLDHDHMIQGATVNIVTSQEGDQLFIDDSMTPNIQVLPLSNTSIQITGTALDNQYQVHP